MQDRNSFSKIYSSVFLFTLLFSLIIISLASCTNGRSSLNQKNDTLANADTSKLVQATLPAADNKVDSLASGDVMEDAVIDTVFKLAEVRAGAAEIETATKGKRRLQVWVEDTPHLPEQEYYVVNTGEDNGNSLVTENTFYVYTNPMRILYYDVVNDTAITLDDWRRDQGR